MTEYGSRKSLSLTARNEYHTNAFKNYVNKLETTVRPVDQGSSIATLNNQQAQGLDEFINGYHNFIVDRFGTRELTKDEVLANILKHMNGDGTNLTNSQMLQLAMIKRDKYQKEIVKHA